MTVIPVAPKYSKTKAGTPGTLRGAACAPARRNVGAGAVTVGGRGAWAPGGRGPGGRAGEMLVGGNSSARFWPQQPIGLLLVLEIERRRGLGRLGGYFRRGPRPEALEQASAP